MTDSRNPKESNFYSKDQKIMSYIPKRLQLHVESCFHDSDGYWIYFDNFIWNTLYDGASVCEDTIKELKNTLKCCQICGIKDKPIKMQNFIGHIFCLDIDRKELANYRINSIIVYYYDDEVTIALNKLDDKELIETIDKSQYFKFIHKADRFFCLEQKTINDNNNIIYFDFRKIVL